MKNKLYFFLFPLFLLGANCVRAQIITTIAGGAYGYSGDGGAATAAQLSQTTGVAVDGSGNFYIADFNNSVVRKVSAGGIITTIVGNGTYGFSGDGGAATDAQLSNPGGVAVDGSGNVYITDYFNHRVRKVSAGVITTFAGNGTSGYTGDGGQATDAELFYPYGIAVDGSGNVYFTSNHGVRKVSAGVITSFAGHGSYGYSGDGGPATAADLNFPIGLAVDVSGNVFIADALNNAIRKVSAGIITTIAGYGAAGYTGDGSVATAARLNYPTGVAVGNGNLYIADYSNNVIRKVRDGIITTLAGNGAFGYTGDGGAATAAELSYDIGIAVNGSGNVYIACYPAIRLVNCSPPIGAITGTTTLTAGSTTTLSDATIGGTWSSSNIAVATIGSTGVVSGVIAGTATITYSSSAGCGSAATILVTVTASSGVPTLSQWGIILLTLLLVAVSMGLLQKQNALVVVPFGVASRNNRDRQDAKLFDRSLYFKSLGGVMLLAVAGLLASYRYFGSLTLTDTMGTFASAFIMAYILQLSLLMKKK